MNRNSKFNRLSAAIVNLINLMIQMVRQFFIRSATSIRQAYTRIRNSNSLNTVAQILATIGLVFVAIVLMIVFGSVLLAMLAGMCVAILILCALVALRVAIKIAIYISLFIVFAIFLCNNISDTVVEEIPAIVEFKEVVNDYANIVCEKTVHFVEVSEEAWNEYWNSEVMTNPDADRTVLDEMMYRGKLSVLRIQHLIKLESEDTSPDSSEVQPSNAPRREKETERKNKDESLRKRHDNVTSPIG